MTYLSKSFLPAMSETFPHEEDDCNSLVVFENNGAQSKGINQSSIMFNNYLLNII
jgi:hypothetical protein